MLGSSSSSIFPTIEQLQSDPFMKQVGYAEFVVGLIQEDAGRGTDVLMRRLNAQLSHPDGIRGFMVTYLARVVDDETDDDTLSIPESLIKAILGQIEPKHDGNELLALMCMNVIMPTAMVTMHKDEELSLQSKITAQRATALLQSVLRDSSINDDSNNSIRTAITEQCQAILKVCNMDENDGAVSKGASNDEATTVKYWSDFFEKWGYQEKQKSDIENAVLTVLSTA